MKAFYLVAIGLVVAAAVGMRGKGARVPRDGKVDSDMAKLVPSFAARVRELLGRMARKGHSAVVWEAYRSQERAKELAAKGVGIEDSMHSLGLAVDIVDASLRWNASQKFWEDLHAQALELGLVRVRHRGKDGVLRWDLPHVQAVPERMKAKLAGMTVEQRDDAIRGRYV